MIHNKKESTPFTGSWETMDNGFYCRFTTHRKRAPSNFFFIRFWSVVRFGSPEPKTFVGCFDSDFPFSLDIGCVSFGFFECPFTSFIFAFSTGSIGGVVATDFLFTTPSEESAGCLPLCFFFGGRLTESVWSRVSISFSRLTLTDSSWSDEALGPCGLFRFLDFFEDEDEASSVETDQPGT